MKKIFLLDKPFEIPIDDSRTFKATIRELLDSDSYKNYGAVTICSFFESAAEYFSEKLNKDIEAVLKDIFREVIEEYDYKTYKDILDNLEDYREIGEKLEIFFQTGLDTLGMQAPTAELDNLVQALSDEGLDSDNVEEGDSGNPWSNFLDNLDLDGI